MSGRMMVPVLAGLFGSCVAFQGNPLSREGIVDRTRVELGKRENWSESPYILAREDPDSGGSRWLVQVDVIDCEVHAECGCALFKPGYGRKLVFTKSGRLLSYERR